MSVQFSIHSRSNFQSKVQSTVHSPAFAPTRASQCNPGHGSGHPSNPVCGSGHQSNPVCGSGHQSTPVRESLLLFVGVVICLLPVRGGASYVTLLFLVLPSFHPN